MEWLDTYEEKHKVTVHGAPRRWNGYIHMRKNIRLPSTEPHADGMATYI